MTREAEQATADAEDAHVLARYGTRGPADHLHKGDRSRGVRRVSHRNASGTATAWRTEYLDVAAWHTASDARFARALAFKGQHGEHRAAVSALDGLRSGHSEQPPQHAAVLVGTLTAAPGAPSVVPGH